jgi:hypothetical protein
MGSPEGAPRNNNMPDVEKNLDANSTSDDRSAEEKPVEQPPSHMDFPEGGRRAWSVAVGTAGVLFCTFGYANGFGLVLPINSYLLLTLNK